MGSGVSLHERLYSSLVQFKGPEQRRSQSYLIGVFDLWRFDQRTNGNRLGARVWIFENGCYTDLLIYC